jgi:A/G-specific adenine glycosylase
MRADGAILLRKRDERGLLGAMSEVPGTDWTNEISTISEVAQAPFTADWRRAAGVVTHVFTHFRLEMTVFSADFPMSRPAPAGAWWSLAESIPNEALPSIFKKIIEAAAPGATKLPKSRAA